MRKLITLLAATAFILSGCAQSPQQVRLSPKVDVSNYLNNQPAVHLSVVDKRPSKILGTRGGVYRNSNHLTLARDLESSLKPIASAALNEMGIVVDQSHPMPTQLKLVVEKLSYQVKDNQTLPIEIKLEAQIAAVADKNGQRQATRYQSGQVHKFFKAPSEEQNEQIINEIVSETLTRLFNDPKLINLIRQ